MQLHVPDFTRGGFGPRSFRGAGMTCRGHAEFAKPQDHADIRSRESEANGENRDMFGHALITSQKSNCSGERHLAHLIQARAPKATNKGLQSLYLRKHAILQRKGA